MYLRVFLALTLALGMMGPGVYAQLPSGSAAPAALGLPPLPAGALSAQHPLAVLGKVIFFDKGLSDNKRIGCVSCHEPERAFADGNRVALGINGANGTRNTPSVLNAVFNTSFFLDGRRATLAEQAIDPFLNGREHGLTDAPSLQDRIAQDAGYHPLLINAFGDKQVNVARIAAALAAFQTTLVSGNSAFDRFHFGGEARALSPAAQRGLALFTGAAGCVACHRIDAGWALFTDHKFHTRGIGELSRAEQAQAQAKIAEVSIDKLHRLIGDDKQVAALGRHAISRATADLHAYRTPSLRNVALTAPYMHDGSIRTLEEAVAWELGMQVRRSDARLTEAELRAAVADITAFLHSLTGTD